MPKIFYYFFFKSIMPNITHNIKIICEIHIAYRYIDPSNCHNFENCLLPWYSHQSCLADHWLLGWLMLLWGENNGRRQFSKLWRLEGSMYLYAMWISHIILILCFIFGIMLLKKNIIEYFVHFVTLGDITPNLKVLTSIA